MKLLQKLVLLAFIMMGGVSGLHAALGDGVVDAGEECDDGNTVDGDGCSATGTIETGYITSCATPTFTYANSTSAGLIGGTGGAAKPDQLCSATDVLIGLKFAWNQTLRGAKETTAICGKVTVDNTTNTVTTTETTRSTQGGTYNSNVSTPDAICQSGYAITGMQGDKGFDQDETTVFSAVKITCSKLGIDGKPLANNSYVLSAGERGKPEYTVAYDQTATCASESIAKKFKTRAGGLQDGLELICAVPTPSCNG